MAGRSYQSSSRSKGPTIKRSASQTKRMLRYTTFSKAGAEKYTKSTGVTVTAGVRGGAPQVPTALQKGTATSQVQATTQPSQPTPTQRATQSFRAPRDQFRKGGGAMLTGYATRAMTARGEIYDYSPSARRDLRDQYKAQVRKSYMAEIREKQRASQALRGKVPLSATGLREARSKLQTVTPVRPAMARFTGVEGFAGMAKATRTEPAVPVPADVGQKPVLTISTATLPKPKVSWWDRTIEAPIAKRTFGRLPSAKPLGESIFKRIEGFEEKHGKIWIGPKGSKARPTVTQAAAFGTGYSVDFYEGVRTKPVKAVAWAVVGFGTGGLIKFAKPKIIKAAGKPVYKYGSKLLTYGIGGTYAATTTFEASQAGKGKSELRQFYEGGGVFGEATSTEVLPAFAGAALYSKIPKRVPKKPVLRPKIDKISFEKTYKVRGKKGDITLTEVEAKVKVGKKVVDVKGYGADIIGESKFGTIFKGGQQVRAGKFVKTTKRAGIIRAGEGDVTNIEFLGKTWKGKAAKVSAKAKPESFFGEKIRVKEIVSAPFKTYAYTGRIFDIGKGLSFRGAYYGFSKKLYEIGMGTKFVEAWTTRTRFAEGIKEPAFFSRETSREFGGFGKRFVRRIRPRPPSTKELQVRTVQKPKVVEERFRAVQSQTLKRQMLSLAKEVAKPKQVTKTKTKAKLKTPAAVLSLSLTKPRAIPKTVLSLAPKVSAVPLSRTIPITIPELIPRTTPKTVPKTLVEVLPKTVTRTMPKTLTRLLPKFAPGPTTTFLTTPPPPPPPPVVFGFDLPNLFFGEGKKRKQVLKKQPRGYTPSLIAAEFRIFGKKPKKISGFEIRPLLKRKGRKKKLFSI